MKKLITIIIFIFLVQAPAYAFWMWTPETNKWVNPKYAVKDTPQEQLKYALTFYESEQYDEALRELHKLIKHYPKAREAAEAKYYRGVIFKKQGYLVKAFKEFQMVLEKYPFSERAAEIVSEQFDIGTRLLEGAGKRNPIIKTIVGGDYDVIEIFRTVIRNAPYGEHAPAAQYKIGLYLQEKGLYQEARDEFEKTMNDYPDTEWANAAKYQIALSDAKRSAGPQYNQAVTQAAIDEFKDFVAKHPDAELTQNARDQVRELREKEAQSNFVIAEFYEKQKQYEAAKVYYSNIVDQYQNTTWATKALKKLQKLNKQ